MTLREWFDDYEIPSDAIIEFYDIDDEFSVGDFQSMWVSYLNTDYQHCTLKELPDELLDEEFDAGCDYMPCPNFVVYSNKYIYTPTESEMVWYLMRVNKNPIYAHSKTK